MKEPHHYRRRRLTVLAVLTALAILWLLYGTDTIKVLAAFITIYTGLSSFHWLPEIHGPFKPPHNPEKIRGK
jgi:hypothetical protein